MMELTSRSTQHRRPGGHRNYWYTSCRDHHRGGLLSLAKPISAMSIVHKVGPFLTMASTIVIMYFLANPQQ